MQFHTVDGHIKALIISKAFAQIGDTQNRRSGAKTRSCAAAMVDEHPVSRTTHAEIKRAKDVICVVRKAVIRDLAIVVAIGILASSTWFKGMRFHKIIRTVGSYSNDLHPQAPVIL